MRPVSLRSLASAFLATALLAGSSFSTTRYSFGFEEPTQFNAAAQQDGFIPLFDGKSFAGWEGDRHWFRIEDETIIAGSLKKDIPHNYFLCTEATYSDFELKLEVKLQGIGDNAGVQFRTKRLPNTTEVSGYQGDVGRAWNRNVWGWLYDESRRNKVLAEAKDEVVDKALKKDDWNELRIKAVGPKIEIFLNGVPTVTFVESDDTADRTGIIGLQIHSGPPTEALYRKIRIKDLSK